MIDLQSFNFAANDYCELIKQDGKISVYRADIPKLGSIVVKQYELTNTIEKLSFRKKQKRLSRLYEKNFSFLPKLYRIGVSEDHQYGHVVYRHIEGVDLRKIDWSELSSELTELIAQVIAENLHALHNAGWVHGDFKFGNVMLDVSSLIDKNHVSIDEVSSHIHIVDVEAAKKPWLSSTNKKSRDIARFLINAEEQSAPKELSVSFWNAYQEVEGVRNKGNADGRRLRAATKQWCHKLSKRHEKKYGKATGINFL